jgi:hypothetical protein
MTKRRNRKWSDAQREKFAATMAHKRQEPLALDDLGNPLSLQRPATADDPNPEPTQPEWIIYRDIVYRRVENGHLIKVIK